MILVGKSYKDQLGKKWRCTARGMNLQKERFAYFLNNDGVVWLVFENEWKLFTKL